MIKRIDSPYTWENPQDGLWWHSADDAGFELFQDKSTEFGKPTTETIPTPFCGKKMIRFGHSRNHVLPYYQGPDAKALIVLNPEELTEDEWTESPQGDRHVLASAVIRVARVREIKT